MTFLPYQLLNQQGIALKRFYTTVRAELTLEKIVSLTELLHFGTDYQLITKLHKILTNLKTSLTTGKYTETYFIAMMHNIIA